MVLSIFLSLGSMGSMDAPRDCGEVGICDISFMSFCILNIRVGAILVASCCGVVISVSSTNKASSAGAT